MRRAIGVRLLLGSMLFVFSLTALGGGESRELAYALIDASTKTFIEHGLCKDKQDCTTKELVFFEAERQDTVHISLYSVRDAKVIEKILSICLQKYEENQRKKTIVLLAWEKSHREYGIWQKMFEDPSIKLHLKGE